MQTAEGCVELGTAVYTEHCNQAWWEEYKAEHSNWIALIGMSLQQFIFRMVLPIKPLISPKSQLLNFVLSCNCTYTFPQTFTFTPSLS